SAIGGDVAANFRALKSGQHGIGPITRLPTHYQGKLLAGEIPTSNVELYNRLFISHDEAYTRSTLLALVAAKEAVKQSGITPVDGLRTGVISATTVGGMDATEQY